MRRGCLEDGAVYEKRQYKRKRCGEWSQQEVSVRRKKRKQTCVLVIVVWLCFCLCLLFWLWLCFSCFLPVILWWSLCVCAFVYGVFVPDDDGTKQTNPQTTTNRNHQSLTNRVKVKQAQTPRKLQSPALTTSSACPWEESVWALTLLTTSC